MLCGMCEKNHGQDAKYCNHCGRPLPQGQADLRVRQALDGLGLKYSVTELGDFTLDCPVGQGRSKRVVVHSSTDRYAGHETRKIYSGSYECHGSIPGQLANRLLEDNGQKKFGAWAKRDPYLVFTSMVEANANKESLYGAILLTVRTADQMEAQLASSTDAF
jgi:hypothetical protein